MGSRTSSTAARERHRGNGAVVQSAQHYGLEGLAPEILLMILTALPSLLSLDSMIRASPSAFRLFNNKDYAVEIMTLIIRAKYRDGYTLGKIDILAHIRSGKLKICDRDAFRRLLIFDVMGDPDYVMMELMKNRDWTDYDMSIASPAVLRSILASARLIENMTVDCLEYYLSNFRAAKPSHLVDKTFHWHGVQPWKNRYDLRLYPTQDVGAPSWVEEQRVSRALWRLQIIHDIKKALSARRLRWPRDVTRWATSQTPMQLLYDSWQYGQTAGNGHSALPFEEIRSVLDWTQAIGGANPMDELGQELRRVDISRLRVTPTPKENDIVPLRYASLGYSFCYRRVESEWVSKWSPNTFLRHLSFAPFRRLGVAFWDGERMAAYGLLKTGERFGDWERSYYETSFYLAAWRSLLSEQELAEQESALTASSDGKWWTKFSQENR